MRAWGGKLVPWRARSISIATPVPQPTSKAVFVREKGIIASRASMILDELAREGPPIFCMRSAILLAVVSQAVLLPKPLTTEVAPDILWLCVSAALRGENTIRLVRSQQVDSLAKLINRERLYLSWNLICTCANRKYATPLAGSSGWKASSAAISRPCLMPLVMYKEPEASSQNYSIKSRPSNRRVKFLPGPSSLGADCCRRAFLVSGPNVTLTARSSSKRFSPLGT